MFLSIDESVPPGVYGTLLLILQKCCSGTSWEYSAHVPNSLTSAENTTLIHSIKGLWPSSAASEEIEQSWKREEEE